MISAQRRQDIISALRRGTVPQRSLDVFAVGMERFEPTLRQELAQVKAGGGVFKCVRGEYGTGKTFFARWLQELAKNEGFATAEVQISEAETPLHRLETVYRRLMERLSTADVDGGALRSVMDGWFYCLEEDALAQGGLSADDAKAIVVATAELMDKRLEQISRSTPAFTAGLRAYRQALLADDTAVAEGLVAWLSGQPNVAAGIKRSAGIKGDIDHYGALACLQGLLVMLRDSGKPGLLLVLDEVETLQRVRSDMREKSLNALRQLIDEMDGGHYPGLFVLITGTPSFFDGTQGMQRLPPLAQRLHVDFSMDGRFDNLRAPQVRLLPFDQARLVQVGMRIRDLYLDDAGAKDRIRAMVDDRYVTDFAGAVIGGLGGKVGVAPRIFLKKLVGDVLDRVDQHPDFDPRTHYQLTMTPGELSEQERAVSGVDDIQLEL